MITKVKFAFMVDKEYCFSAALLLIIVQKMIKYLELSPMNISFYFRRIIRII